ncbi:2-hydroxyacid dehydrogenase-like [Porphyridium purpureum]|uniref:2-hydroxyacid dehydrogenase-like n=1 Tax=Porphyridium purpureum TaxID=35688 RepID=A0A5J4YPA7_PORPP|nr:2-hydroxyacid dehydrogenase-like [Porphyridium purpureum]|eukprot:POR9288..scf296_7
MWVKKGKEQHKKKTEKDTGLKAGCWTSSSLQRILGSSGACRGFRSKKSVEEMENVSLYMKKFQRQAKLSDAVIEQLMGALEGPLSFVTGQVVFEQGVQDGYMYIVGHGEIVAVVKEPAAEDDKEGSMHGPLKRRSTYFDVLPASGSDGNADQEPASRVLRTFGPADSTGFSSLIERRPHSATVVCATDSTLWRLGSAAFEAVLADPVVARHFLASLSAMLQALRHDYFGLALEFQEDRPEHYVASGQSLSILVFDSRSYWTDSFRPMLEQSELHSHWKIEFEESRLSESTVQLAAGYKVVCCFVNDLVNAKVMNILKALNVEMVAMRCAGYDNVDLAEADKLGITVARVPAYSPNAVAEHAVALLMTLNRKTHIAFNRVRDGNFLLDGLAGFDMKGIVVGVVGTGKIGQHFIEIMLGFGCKVLCYDAYQAPSLKDRSGVTYTDMDTLLSQSRVVSLHLPLLESTKNMISTKQLESMPKGALLINTSRGGLVDTEALIRSLKAGHLGGAGLDVYSNESGYFFENWSMRGPIQDDDLSRLMSFNNVLITSHQAFLTTDALDTICRVTLSNIKDFQSGNIMHTCENSINSPLK